MSTFAFQFIQIFFLKLPKNKRNLIKTIFVRRHLLGLLDLIRKIAFICKLELVQIKCFTLNLFQVNLLFHLLLEIEFVQCFFIIFIFTLQFQFNQNKDVNTLLNSTFPLKIVTVSLLIFFFSQIMHLCTVTIEQKLIKLQLFLQFYHIKSSKKTFKQKQKNSITNKFKFFDYSSTFI
ncbi:hypothetical protein ABPG74_016374 [Tetrahymena malaccensis]